MRTTGKKQAKALNSLVLLAVTLGLLLVTAGTGMADTKDLGEYLNTADGTSGNINFNISRTIANASCSLGYIAHLTLSDFKINNTVTTEECITFLDDSTNVLGAVSCSTTWPVDGTATLTLPPVAFKIKSQNKAPGTTLSATVTVTDFRYYDNYPAGIHYVASINQSFTVTAKVIGPLDVSFIKIPSFQATYLTPKPVDTLILKNNGASDTVTSISATSPLTVISSTLQAGDTFPTGSEMSLTFKYTPGVALGSGDDEYSTVTITFQNANTFSLGVQASALLQHIVYGFVPDPGQEPVPMYGGWTVPSGSSYMTDFHLKEGSTHFELLSSIDPEETPLSRSAILYPGDTFYTKYIPSDQRNETDHYADVLVDTEIVSDGFLRNDYVFPLIFVGKTRYKPEATLEEQSGGSVAFINQPITSTFVLTNNSLDDTLTLTDILIADDGDKAGDDDQYYSIISGKPSSSNPVPLGPGASHSFEITYSASALGRHEAIMAIKCEYDEAPSSILERLVKTTISPPAADLQSSALDLFTYQGVPIDQFCTVRNAGAYPVDITGISLSGTDAGQFTINNPSGLTGSLSPGEIREINITYSGSELGTHTASLVVSYTYCGVAGSQTFTNHLEAETITTQAFGNDPMTYMEKNGYLSETSITPFTDEIVALNNQLFPTGEIDPVAIYNWVYENIEVKEYTGLRMGAQATLLSGHGNSWDISALLVALLREAGIPARFVINKMERMGREVDIAYVEAWLLLDNYRSGTAGQCGEWVPLAPWFKQYEYTKGKDLFPDNTVLPALNFDFDGYLSTTKQQTAIESFEEQMQAYLSTNYPGTSLANVPFTERVIKTPASILPSTLPKGFTLTGTSTRVSEIPETFRSRANIAFKKSSTDELLMEHTVYLSDVAGKRLYMDFEPDEENQWYIPRLNLEDTPLCQGTIIFPNETYYTETTYEIDGQDPGAEPIVIKRPARAPGTFVHIALDCLPASEKNIEKLKKELAAINLTTLDGQDGTDYDAYGNYLGIMSNILADTFYYRFREAMETATDLAYSKADWSGLCPVFIYTDPFKMELPNPDSKFLFHPTWMIDAWLHMHGPFKYNDASGTVTYTKLPVDNPVYMLCRRLAGYTGSFNEAAIFEDWQDTQALSTVKGLMFANEQADIDVTTIERTKDSNGIELTPAAVDTSSLEAVSETREMDGVTVRNRLWDGTDSADLWDPLDGPVPDYIQEIKDTLLATDEDGAFIADSVVIPKQMIHFDEGLSGYVNLALGKEADGYLFSMYKPGHLTSGLINGGTSLENTSAITFDGDSFSVYGGYEADEITFSLDQNTTLMFSPLTGEDLLFKDTTADMSLFGDPVNLLTGEFYQEELPDFQLPSPGPTEELDLALKRGYYSQMVYNGPFGYGWSWNHGDRIVFMEVTEEGGVPEEKILYYQNESVPDLIKDEDSDGVFELPAGVLYTFNQNVTGGYEVHHKDTGVTSHFSTDGKLLRKQDRFGNHLEFGYNSYGQMVYIRDGLGRKLTFLYGANGKVSRVTDTAGNQCSYYYGATVVGGVAGVGDKDDLTAFVDVEGNITRYEYLMNQDNPANNHNMCKYILPKGAATGNTDYLKIGYYKNDQVSYHENADGAVFNFQYSRINRYGETWDEEGYYRKVFFDANNNEIKVISEDGTLIEKEYDGHHNIISMTDGNGNNTSFDYGAYPAERKLHTKTNALLEIWTYYYDETDNPATNTYFYAPSRVVQPKFYGAEAVYTEYDYDDVTGALLEKREAPGYIIDPTLAPNNPNFGMLLPSSVSLGLVTTYTYDNYGNITSITDPNNNTEERLFDGYGLYLMARIDRNNSGSATPRKTLFAYYHGGETGPRTGMPQPVGALRSIIDPEGNKTTFEYNRYGQKRFVTDPLGGVMEYRYDKNRKLVKQIAPNGAVVENVYGSARDIVAGADMIKQIDPLGNQLFYDYDKRGHIIRKVDRNGNDYRYFYDGMGRLTEEVDPYDNALLYEYDGNGNLTAQADKRGYITYFEYDAANRLRFKDVPRDDQGYDTTEYRYDANGNREYEIAADGIVTYYEYDGLNRLIAKTVAKTVENVTMSYTWEYRYDASGRLIKEISPRGDYTVTSYDANGNKTATQVYSNAALLLKETLYDSYDANNRLLQYTDMNVNAAGDDYVHGFEYDGLGRKTAAIAVDNETGFEYLTSYHYDAVGNLVMETDRAGHITSYTYDLAKRRTGIINAMDARTTFRYDANGNLLVTTDARGNETWTYYDALDRKVAAVDAEGGETTFDYDENGNLVYVTGPTGHTREYRYDAQNRKVKDIDGLGNATLTAYDAMGRVQTVTDPQNVTTEYEYNDPLGRQTKITRASGEADQVVTTFAYDITGGQNKVTKTEAVGTQNIVTETYYDAFGNIDYMIDARDNMRDFDYDSLGRMTDEYDAETANNHKQIKYDYNNNTKQVTKRDGTVIDYGYDERGLITDIAIGPTLVQAFAYDAVGRMTRAIDYNYQAGVQTQAHTVDFGYNELNQVVLETQGDHVSGGVIQNSRQVAKAYDKAGRGTGITYPYSYDLTRSYNPDGTLGSVTSTARDVIYYTDYDANGRLTNATMTNNVSLYLSYDSLGRETSRSYTPGGASLLYGMSTTQFDLRGNIKTEITNPNMASEETRTYTYDDMDRILTESGADALYWEYDAAGNWTDTNQNGAIEIRTVNSDNEYTAITAMSPAYDHNGNLVSDGARDYVYDWANRLVEVKETISGSTIESYTYDALNRRVTVTNSGGAVRYIYDNGQVVEEYNNTSGAFLRAFVYGRAKDDVVMMESTGGAVYYYLKDKRGSITALTDGSGAVVETYEYSAFGLMTIKNGSGVVISQSAYGNPYGYTGQRWDNATGLWYYRNRMYSPALGRFMQRDPVGYVDGMNLYAYVKNNPMLFIDPLGLMARSATMTAMEDYFGQMANDAVMDLNTISMDALGDDYWNPLDFDISIGDFGSFDAGMGLDSGAQRILLADSGFASDMPLNYGSSSTNEGSTIFPLKNFVGSIDKLIMSAPGDSFGFNTGGSLSLRLLAYSGPRGSLSTVILFDAEKIVIAAIQERGYGFVSDKFSASLFSNAVFGINGATAEDMLGSAFAFSGTSGPINFSLSAPLPLDLENPNKGFFEIGLCPRMFGGEFEVGASMAQAQGFIIPNPLADEGKWWGDLFFDLLH